MKNEKLIEKGIKENVILDKTFKFSIMVIEAYKELKKTEVGRIIGKQLLRSATSIGANVHEAQGGQSKADFIAKISISQKEAHETIYWLRLITETETLPYFETENLLDEANQILKILSAILVASKNHVS